MRIGPVRKVDAQMTAVVSFECVGAGRAAPVRVRGELAAARPGPPGEKDRRADVDRSAGWRRGRGLGRGLCVGEPDGVVAALHLPHLPALRESTSLARRGAPHWHRLRCAKRSAMLGRRYIARVAAVPKRTTGLGTEKAGAPPCKMRRSGLSRLSATSECYLNVRVRLACTPGRTAAPHRRGRRSASAI